MSRKRKWQILLLMAGLALTLRLGARLYLGEADFWENGYAFFAELSRNIAAGKGITFDDGVPTAFRVPVYPAFLALITFGHGGFLAVAFWQSLIGAGTVILAALLASELFVNEESGVAAQVGIIAAAITAIYPYYVVHDTALQQTSLFTFLTALGVLLALQARHKMSLLISAIAGFVFAIATLTDAILAPFAIIFPILLVIPRRSVPNRRQWRLGCAALCMVVIAVAPWLARSYALNGTPTLSGEIGHFLWLGNNPQTFSRYPTDNIDEVEKVALEALNSDERAQIEALDGDAKRSDRWFLVRALQFIVAHPWQTLVNDVHKLAATFGVLPSPRQTVLIDFVYALSYGPVLILGLWGMCVYHRDWRDHLIIYGLFACFSLITATFFGHTSYRVYLDVYLIVFAARILATVRQSVAVRGT